MNIWVWKNFVRIGSHTICESLKKRLVSIGRKKCFKNTIAVLPNTSMTSWQVMNRGFTRINPKVNSSRLYGCFKMSPIQILKSCSLPSKWSLVFSEKLDCSTRTMQNSQFWVVHNYLFASCLPSNQENQPPKTDHSSPRQCELSHIATNNFIFKHSKHRFDESSV